MTDKLFIQFYSTETNPDNKSYALNNGFSDAWDYCRYHGDMIWYEHDITTHNYLNDNLYWDYELPITKGIVYISAVYSFHLYQACVWAERYPNIHFIVGGPVVFEKPSINPHDRFLFFKINEELPSNITLTGRSVEEYFDIPNYSYDWKLELPPEVKKRDTIKFSYTLENQCYWKRCIFCSTTRHNSDHLRTREHMNLNLDELIDYHKLMIRLNTGSITPYHIQHFIPKLVPDKHIYYYIFLRIVKSDFLCLRDTLVSMDDRPNLKFGLGLEFPTERMWRYVNKGFRMDSLDLFSDVCEECNIKMSLNFILGWNNLIEQDIIDLEKMLNKIPDSIVETIRLWWLFAFQNTEIYNTYMGADEADLLGPFNFGFIVKVDDHQMELNRQAGELIKNRFGHFNDNFSNFTRGII